MLPLFINISKYHCDFMVEFFFDDVAEIQSEEEYRNILMSSNTKFKKSISHNEIQVKEKPKAHSEKEKSYPTYFKHVRINETELVINFFFNDNSPFVNI